jgi:hypothetical protein
VGPFSKRLIWAESEVDISHGSKPKIARVARKMRANRFQEGLIEILKTLALHDLSAKGKFAAKSANLSSSECALCLDTCEAAIEVVCLLGASRHFSCFCVLFV